MKKQVIIRDLAAAAMLLLFTLSIMPRLYLHDIFASHKDIVANLGSTDTNIAKNGYSCDLSDLVATSPFTEAQQQIVINPDIFFPVLHTRYTSQIATAAPDCFSLRGPPALA